MKIVPGNGLESKKTQKKWFEKLSMKADAMTRRNSRFVSIRFKVGGTFAAILVVILLMGIVSVWRLISLQGEVKTLASQDMKIVELAGNIKQDLLSMEAGMRGYLITGNQSLLDSSYTSQKTDYTKQAALLKPLVQGNPSFQQDLENAIDPMNKWVSYADQQIQMRSVGQGNQAMMDESAGNGDGFIASATSNLDRLISSNQQKANAGADSLKSSVLITLIFMAILTLVAVLVSIIFGVPATFSTPRHLNRVTRILRDIASARGDLTRRIEGVHSRDVVERLVTATNELLGSIANLVRSVVGTSETLAASAQELTASADDTARAVNAIAATAGEFASLSDQAAQSLTAMTQSVETVKTHGDSMAVKVNDVVYAVGEVVKSTDEGSTLVIEAQTTMTQVQAVAEETHRQVAELEKSSRQIAQILTTIRDISDQTNLLALNAAIEAARAGDAGRGFAVVAQEVRKLAEQSRQAAMEIDTIVKQNQKLTKQVYVLMSEGVESVAKGRVASDNTRVAFEQIRLAVERVVPNTEEILESVQQQLQLTQSTLMTIETLTKYMDEVASGAEENAAGTEETLATVEEIAGSAHALAGLAQELQETVGKFQI